MASVVFYVLRLKNIHLLQGCFTSGSSQWISLGKGLCSFCVLRVSFALIYALLELGDQCSQNTNVFSAHLGIQSSVVPN